MAGYCWWVIKCNFFLINQSLLRLLSFCKSGRRLFWCIRILSRIIGGIRHSGTCHFHSTKWWFWGLPQQTTGCCRWRCYRWWDGLMNWTIMIFAMISLIIVIVFIVIIISVIVVVLWINLAIIWWLLLFDDAGWCCTIVSSILDLYNFLYIHNLHSDNHVTKSNVFFYLTSNSSFFLIDSNLQNNVFLERVVNVCGDIFFIWKLTYSYSLWHWTSKLYSCLFPCNKLEGYFYNVYNKGHASGNLCKIKETNYWEK